MLNKDFTQSVFILIVSIFVVASFSLLVWVLPNVLTASDIQKRSTAIPLTPSQLAGRDVYISEGCHVCHTQMVRPLMAEIARYGPPSKQEHDVYEHPNLWGSKRTGPDLANLGRKYSDHWHEIHLKNPRNVVPTSIMPSFPWLFESVLDGEDIQDKMRSLRTLGVPYSDEQISSARLEVRGRTKGEVLISYLQQMGVTSASGKEAKP